MLIALEIFDRSYIENGCHLPKLHLFEWVSRARREILSSLSVRSFDQMMSKRNADHHSQQHEILFQCDHCGRRQMISVVLQSNQAQGVYERIDDQ